MKLITKINMSIRSFAKETKEQLKRLGTFLYRPFRTRVVVRDTAEQTDFSRRPSRLTSILIMSVFWTAVALGVWMGIEGALEVAGYNTGDIVSDVRYATGNGTVGDHIRQLFH